MEGIVKNSGVQLVMVGDANQQIYAWRGAEDALSRFDAPHRLPLSQSFRFGEKIADEANKWLTLLNAPVPIKGFEKIDSKVKKIDDPDAILCRTNAQTIAEAMALSELGLSFSIVGGTAEIKAFARGADDLQNNRPTEHPELFMFKNWEHFKEHVEAEGGSDLDVFIRLVENYGTTTIIEVADSSLKREALADVVISTAHKAKGREWPRVQIAPDFKEPGPDPETGQERMPSKAEMQLAYVACTRAGKVLDNTAMDWINRWLPEKKEEDNGRIIASALREARGQ
jgi:superfamily I DNA/RNA helicase